METLKAPPLLDNDCLPADSHSAHGPDQLPLERATMLLGCYRRDEANNPEVYIAAVAAVLSEFQPDVIEYVTDPRTGLPRTSKWPPNPAEVAEACEARRRYLDAISSGWKYQPAKPIAYGRKRTTANVLVRREAPQYAAMLELAQKAPEHEWCHDAEGRGIWVSRNWLPTMRAVGRFETSPQRPAQEAAE